MNPEELIEQMAEALRDVHLRYPFADEYSRSAGDAEAAYDAYKAQQTQVLSSSDVGKTVLVDHPRYHGEGVLSRVDSLVPAMAWVRLQHGDDRVYEASTVRLKAHQTRTVGSDGHDEDCPMRKTGSASV